LKLTRELPRQNGPPTSSTPIRIKHWFYFRSVSFPDPARLRSIALLTCCSPLTLPATGASLPILFRPSMPNLVNGAAFHSNLSARIARTKCSQVWQLENPVLIRIQGEGR